MNPDPQEQARCQKPSLTPSRGRRGPGYRALTPQNGSVMDLPVGQTVELEIACKCVPCAMLAHEQRYSRALSWLAAWPGRPTAGAPPTRTQSFPLAQATTVRPAGYGSSPTATTNSTSQGLTTLAIRLARSTRTCFRVALWRWRTKKTSTRSAGTTWLFSASITNASSSASLLSRYVVCSEVRGHLVTSWIRPGSGEDAFLLRQSLRLRVVRTLLFGPGDTHPADASFPGYGEPNTVARVVC